MDSEFGFKWEEPLWRSRRTPIDSEVEAILRKHSGDPEFIFQFLNIYVFVRNGVIKTIIPIIKMRRTGGYLNPLSDDDQKRLTSLRHVLEARLVILKRLIYGLTEGELTKEKLNEIFLVFQNDTVATAYSNLFENLKFLKDPANRKTYVSEGFRNRWYRYVRKAMGVFNTPRDDLPARIKQKEEDRLNDEACMKRAQEIIDAKQ